MKSAAIAVVLTLAVTAQGADQFDYRVLATNKTSTMEKEINEAADAGYEFKTVMGGETAVGGNEVVVVMAKKVGSEAKAVKRYKLLATNKTSTMQKELQQAGDEGFRYCGQTVFSSTFGGREVALILEREVSGPTTRIEYKLLATSKTSTMQKELQQVGEEGFEIVGTTVAKTALGGSEILSILHRPAK